MSEASIPALPRPPAALLERLQAFSVATLCDCLETPALMSAAIQPLRPDWRLAGPALTVEVPPSDNLLTHLALLNLQPGDVLVVAVTPEVVAVEPQRAMLGGLMAATAARLQAAGIIVDGLVRDSPELAAGGLPVFARGASPLKPGKNGPGRINHTVHCGGVAVAAGDLVIADRDGVLVVPPARLESLLEQATALTAAEAERLRTIAEGPTSALMPSWLFPALRARGLIADEPGP